MLVCLSLLLFYDLLTIGLSLSLSLYCCLILMFAFVVLYGAAERRQLMIMTS